MRLKIERNQMRFVQKIFSLAIIFIILSTPSLTARTRENPVLDINNYPPSQEKQIINDLSNETTKDHGTVISENRVKNESQKKIEFKQVNANLITVNYKFSEPKIKKTEEKEGKIYYSISVDDLPHYGKPGYPVLPFYTAYILIPTGKRVENIDVFSEGKKSYPRSYLIEYGKKPIPISSSSIEHDSANMTIYNSTNPYPIVRYSDISIQKKMDFNILVINIHPLEYIPKNGKISYFDIIRIEINLSPDKTAKFSTSQRLELVRKIVDNPQLLDKFPIPLQDPTYQYVIITNENLLNTLDPYNFQTLRDDKISRGITSTIVTLEWIYTNFDGTRPDGGVDDQTRIRNFIIYAYNTWGTLYVLLGGDGDGGDVGGESGDKIIPHRGFSADGDVDIPADMYYCCLDGTFDNNQNGIYGEANDGIGGGEIDLFAEVYVGRVCADSQLEVQNFVRKTLSYQTMSLDDNFRKVSMVGELLNQNPLTWGGDYKDEIIFGSSSYGYSTVGFRYSVYSDFLGVSTLYDRDDPNHNWPVDSIIDMINSNVNIINHMGHANVNYLMKMTNDEVDTLLTNNDLFFIGYSQGCYSGSFDGRDSIGEYLNVDCIVEHLTVGTNGAVAFIANSRYGWYAPGSTDGPSQHYDREFWDAILGEGILSLGIANHDSKEDNAGRIGWDRYCYYELNLFGDPELQVRLPPPRHMGWVGPENRAFPGETRDPSIAVDSDGNLYKAYSLEPFDGYSKIWIEKSTDNGVNWNNIKEIVDLNHNLGYPSIAVDIGDNNKLYVVFEREWTSSDHDIFVARYANSIWNYYPVANSAGSDDRYPSVTCEYQYGTSDCQYISYEYVDSDDDRDLMFAKSENDGATWSLTKIHGGWPDGNVHTQTSITTVRGSDGDDHIYIAYAWGADCSSTYSIRIDKSSNQGTTWSQQDVLDYYVKQKGYPTIAASRGRGTVILACQTYYDDTWLNDIEYAYSTDNGDSWSAGWVPFETVDERLPSLTSDGQSQTSMETFGYFHISFWRGDSIIYMKTPWENSPFWSLSESLNNPPPVYGIYSRLGLTTRSGYLGSEQPAIVYSQGDWIQYSTRVPGHSIQSNQIGISVEVDGDSYNAPREFYWVEYTDHVINAPTPQTVDSQQYGFVYWSDYGDRSHTITAGVSDEELTAYFTPIWPPTIDYLALYSVTDDVWLSSWDDIARGKTLRIYYGIHDEDTPIGYLSVSISYRPSGGSWTTFPALYDWILENCYYIDWAIPEDAALGLYDVKVDAADAWGLSTSQTDFDGFNVVARAQLAFEDVRSWYWNDNTEINCVVKGDVDSDGSNEIVTGGYYFDGDRECAQLVVWDGSTLTVKGVQAWYWFGDTRINSVAIENLDGDEALEIVTGGFYFDGVRKVAQLVVWDGETLSVEKVETWYWTGDTVINSLVLADVDGDSVVEVVTGGSYNDGTFDHAQIAIWEAETLAYEKDTHWQWIGDTQINSVQVADVDGDASLEVVTGGYYTDGQKIAQLVVWDGETLSVETLTVWSWIDDTVLNSVEVGNVDGDVEYEVVTGGFYNDGSRDVAQLVVWSSDLHTVEDLAVWYWTSDTRIDSICVADADSDGSAEIVTGGSFNDLSRDVAQLVVWDGATLSVDDATSWYWTSDTCICSVVVGNTDGDIASEIITGGYFNDSIRTWAQISIWEIS